MRTTWLAIIIIIFLSTAGLSHAAIFPPLPPCLAEGPLPAIPSGETATGFARGAQLVLWRIECDVDPDRFVALLRVPQEEGIPACPSPITFTCPSCGTRHLIINGDSCSALTEARTSPLDDLGSRCFFPTPSCPPPARPNREEVSIQFDGVTVAGEPVPARGASTRSAPRCATHSRAC
jgi:hypothetical protein